MGPYLPYSLWLPLLAGQSDYLSAQTLQHPGFLLPLSSIASSGLPPPAQRLGGTPPECTVPFLSSPPLPYHSHIPLFPLPFFLAPSTLLFLLWIHHLLSVYSDVHPDTNA